MWSWEGTTWFALKEVTSYAFPPSINKSFTLLSLNAVFKIGVISVISKLSNNTIFYLYYMPKKPP